MSPCGTPSLYIYIYISTPCTRALGTAVEDEEANSQKKRWAQNLIKPDVCKETGEALARQLESRGNIRRPAMLRNGNDDHGKISNADLRL